MFRLLGVRCVLKVDLMHVICFGCFFIAAGLTWTLFLSLGSPESLTGTWQQSSAIEEERFRYETDPTTTSTIRRRRKRNEQQQQLNPPGKDAFEEQMSYRYFSNFTKLDEFHIQKAEQTLTTSNRLNGHNLLISGKSAQERNLTDDRHQMCLRKHYPKSLPRVSLIICFYNEEWSLLLRTVHTVLTSTPNHLLHEIILVDDFSDYDNLGKPLQDYLTSNLSQVRLIRTARREGLIRARIIGSDNATGKVLVFMDSHCVVNSGWLEPLLAHIAVDQRRVAIPTIDVIHPDTLEHYPMPSFVRGGFDWTMFFKWDFIPEHLLQQQINDPTRPIMTPTMAGGIFAIDRLYFNRMGKYDPGMELWGAENLEISFRMWQCGGRLDILPCSRVGHVDRKRQKYDLSDDDHSFIRNSLRVVHVWMDDYKKFFFIARPEARNRTFGDVTERVKLRRRLRCRSFQWYMENVFPEKRFPSPNYPTQMN